MIAPLDSILDNILQVAELASLAQLLPPRSPTVRNPAPDSSLCRAAPRLRPLQLLLAACVRFSCCSRARLRHPLQLLLPVCLRFQLLLPDCACLLAACVHFSCCSRSRPLRLLFHDCVRFNCCSPMAPLQLLLARLRSLRLLLSYCTCWIPAHVRMPEPMQCSRTFFAEFEVQ